MAKPKKEVKKETPKERRARILKQDEERAKMGSPEWPFEREIAEEICFIISTQRVRIDKLLASDSRYPSKDLFYKWLFKSKDFAEMYREAKEYQQEILVDSQEDELERARKHTYRDKEGNDKIDAGAVALAKLACDNIKWEAARRNRRTFGDNKEEQNKVDGTMTKVNALMEKSRASKKRDY